jgi:chemotaxis protein methyltransferase CheR
MKTENFDLLAGLLKQRSGLVLTKEKVYLLESRLLPLARKRGIPSLDDLVQSIRTKRDEALLRDVTEAMTTNESFFFRDNTPFDIFRDHLLPTLMKSRAGTRQLRIWCAAASTGQEPYSIAMILKERAAQLQGWRVDILGTDLSNEVLEKAKAGLYTQFEVQRGLPIQLLVKYFAQVGDLWQIDASIRSMVRYREFNLLNDPRELGQFDVIFCRNVLIYFDQPTKSLVLDRLARQLPEDGTLFLGAAETVLGLCDRFKPVKDQRGLYMLNNAPAANGAGASVTASGLGLATAARR